MQKTCVFKQIRFDTALATPYYCAPMSSAPPDTVLPRHIDPRKFAQQGISIHGQVALAELERLLPLLAGNEGEVQSNLVFGIDEQGIRYLTGEVHAQVSMVCQRCLGDCPQELNLPLNLGMVWSDDDARQLTKSWDPWIVGEGQCDIYQVIEDELILGLPIVAYHDYDCVAQELFSSGDADTNDDKDSADKDRPNPFQALEQLKGQLKQDS